MTSLSPKSPLWRKPSDIMKFRKLKSRKRILQKRLGYEERETGNIHRDSSGPNRLCLSGAREEEHVRTNPFRHSPRKRHRCGDLPRVPSPVNLSDVSCDSTLFQLLQASGQITSDAKVKEDVGKVHTQEEEHIPLEVTDDGKSVEQWQALLPFDWSLKTAMRMTSTQPFPWNPGRLTTSEEASGITGHVRCLPLSRRTSCCALDTSTNAQLFQCCQVWMHPSLPWLKLFPRHQTRMVASVSNDIKLPTQISKSLHSDWAESFQSLFHLLRARQCPYFYVCAQGFTVLFRAAGIGGNPRIHVLMTPTTVGLRLALTEEGVHFSLPLRDESAVSMENETPPDEIETCMDGHCEEDLVTWLKSAGVEDRMVKQIDRDLASSDKQKEIDYRAESLVYVEDSDVHALFNFLLNSKSCTATYGPMAGIPPTLFAPVAFTGSTLRSLKMRQQKAQQGAEQMNVFDLTGPILPHTMHYLNNLLQARVQDAHFDMTFSTLEPTAPFCMFSSETDSASFVFGQQSLSDCGLSTEVVQVMCTQKKGVLLREVKASKNGYCWTS